MSDDLEPRLRALVERAPRGQRDHLLVYARHAAAIGDELGYARGRAEVLEEAAAIAEPYETGEKNGYGHCAIRARAAELKGGG